MNRRTVLMAVDAVLAVVCVVAAVLSWRQGVQTTQFAPMGEVPGFRSEEHTSELQSIMRISYADFCFKKKKYMRKKTHKPKERICNTQKNKQQPINTIVI